MSNVKIILVYKDESEDIKEESVWAIRNGEFYKIDNIPFFAPNLALGDIVKVEKEGELFYFDELIEASGHSTIQLVFFDISIISKTGNELVQMGCTWEGSHLPNLISVDIPKHINYRPIKDFLHKGEKNQLWSYKESCLSHSYK